MLEFVMSVGRRRAQLPLFFWTCDSMSILIFWHSSWAVRLASSRAYTMVAFRICDKWLVASTLMPQQAVAQYKYLFTPCLNLLLILSVRRAAESPAPAFLLNLWFHFRFFFWWLGPRPAPHRAGVGVINFSGTHTRHLIIPLSHHTVESNVRQTGGKPGRS